MRGQVTLQVTMELLSDAIFGSGFSVPGERISPSIRMQQDIRL